MNTVAFKNLKYMDMLKEKRKAFMSFHPWSGNRQFEEMF